MQIIPIKRPRILSKMDEIKAVKNPVPEGQVFNVRIKAHPIPQ
jgi:hypothetical protein